MKKLRCSLATIALLATLAGSFFLQGMGSASLANAAFSHHASSGSTLSAIAIPNWPCGSAANAC